MIKFISHASCAEGHIVTILLTMSCGSEISVTLLGDTAETSNEKEHSPQTLPLTPSSFEILNPDIFYLASETGSIVFPLSRIEGNTPLALSDLALTGKGTATCSSISISEASSESPQISLSECSGRGRIRVTHKGTNESVEVYISADNLVTHTTTTVRPVSLTLSSDGEKLYALDMSIDSIYTVDINTGALVKISGQGRGVGVDLENNNSFVKKSDDSLGFVMTDFSAIQVDLLTGDRSILSDISNGSGVNISQGKGLVINSSETSLYYLNGATGALMKLDIATGDRVVVSDAGTGTGSVFSSPIAVDIDNLEAKGYVIDSILKAVFEVDLASGNRTIISDITQGTGPNFENLSGALLTENETKIIVLNNFGAELLEVEISTGNRSIILDMSAGKGPALLPQGMGAFNTEGTKLYLPSWSSWVLTGLIIEVDLVSENKSIVSSILRGQGEEDLRFLIDTFFSISDDRLYTIGRNIQKVDIDNGDRVKFPKSTSYSNIESFVLNSDRSVSYIVDGFYDLVSKIDLLTGETNKISGDWIAPVGSGPSFVSPFGVAVNIAETTLYITDRNQSCIFSVDTTTGERTIISRGHAPAIGSGEFFLWPGRLKLDSSGNFVYVLASGGGNHFFKVELSTGNRTVLSGWGGPGGGPYLPDPEHLAIDSTETFAYVIDSTLVAVLKINILNGDREIIADSTIGFGFPLVEPVGVEINSDDTFLYIGDATLGSVIKIDLSTGERSLVSK